MMETTFPLLSRISNLISIHQNSYLFFSISQHTFSQVLRVSKINTAQMQKNMQKMLHAFLPFHMLLTVITPIFPHFQVGNPESCYWMHICSLIDN